MDKINFGARKLGTVNVLKLTDKGYTPCKVDLGKFNIASKRDWNKIEELKDDWNCKLVDILYERCMNLEFDLARKNVFFISEPQKYRLKDKFEPQKVLGVALFIQYPLKNHNFLAILQKNPKYLSCHQNGFYKHVGQEFINFFKQKYCKKPILLYSAPEAKGFYERLGFINLEGKENFKYIWKA